MSADMNGTEVKFEPAIYEHKAVLIGREPREVAMSADLLSQAVLKEHEVYRADYVTVGLDVYNVEAEALGSRATVPDAHACPDLDGLLYDLNDLPELHLPAIPPAGRFQILIDAGKRVREAIGGQTAVRVAASGPVTMAAKLVGLEALVMSLVMDDGHAMRLLEFTTRIAEAWCSCLRSNGLDAIVFDSMAAPPMLSPDMVETIVLPLHQRLMSVLAEAGQSERELVIGGDTSAIAGLMKQSGATIILCDYAADAAAFKANLGDDGDIQVRRNINPALLAGSDAGQAETFRRELALFSRPIAGTGILPYDFPPERLLEFMKLVGPQAKPKERMTIE